MQSQYCGYTYPYTCSISLTKFYFNVAYAGISTIYFSEAVMIEPKLLTELRVKPGFEPEKSPQLRSIDLNLIWRIVTFPHLLCNVMSELLKQRMQLCI